MKEKKISAGSHDCLGSGEPLSDRYSLKDLLDLERLAKIFEKFSKATGYTVGLVDHPARNVLIATGWRDICTKFHRVYPASVKHCQDSNVALTEKLSRSKQFSIQQCENGLVDAATPVVIRGRHVASLATGQVLLQDPDREQFRKRALDYGYNEEAYLKALDEVPVVSEEKTRNAISFLSEIAVMLAELGLANQQMKEHAKELAAEKERLGITLRSIADGVIATDEKGRVVLLNEAAELYTGWKQDAAIGLPLEEVFCLLDEDRHSPCSNLVARIIAGDPTAAFVQRMLLVALDGTERIVTTSGAVICGEGNRITGMVLVFHDMTEASKMEQQLINAQKLESIGLLAGGIAHDFNNILTGILGSVSLARSYSSRTAPEVNRLLERIEKASLRARDLTQQLLTFAKGGAPVKQVSDLTEIIRDSANFSLRGSKTNCHFEFADDLWAAEVDPGQIGQVVQNIVINAEQAMVDGGTITVTGRNVPVQEAVSRGLRPVPHVEIAIADQGPGISEERLGKIFDPYFTTKEKGRGLGLFVTYSVIKNHDGQIAVDTEVGEGTTFQFCIPSLAASWKRSSEEGEREIVPGNGRVLVMDDEEIVRDIASVILSEAGYDVVAVEDGGQAIELYSKAAEQGRPFSCLVLDLTVPGGMGGQATLEKLRALHGEVNAVASTGYYNDPVMANHRDYGFAGAVSKPYRYRDLLKVVGQVSSEQ